MRFNHVFVPPEGLAVLLAVGDPPIISAALVALGWDFQRYGLPIRKYSTVVPLLMVSGMTSA